MVLRLREEDDGGVWEERKSSWSEAEHALCLSQIAGADQHYIPLERMDTSLKPAVVALEFLC